LDTITPPSWAEAALRTLPNARYYEFPGQGHLVIQQPLSIASGCPAQMARAFLDTPAQAPDASCIGENYRIEWSLPGQDLPE
jgi:hypothetical protein